MEKTEEKLITSDTNETVEDDLQIAGPWKPQIKYSYAFTLLYFHAAAAYGIYLALTSAKWQTNLFAYAMFWLSGIGIFAGAHRLFSHKTYKASKPLEVFLMLCQSVAYQKSLVTWVLDHRLHHQYSDTDGDPHNPSRGFFFAHIGWVLCKKHPAAVKRAKQIDMSDVYSNPILMFQMKHQVWFLPTLAFFIPTLIPMIFWNESFVNSWHVNMARYMFNLHLTFVINSISHRWGTKRYDKSKRATGSLLITLASFGEGSHNYHHVFPHDYRGAELGTGFLNFITYFIDFCALLGLAYDRKTVSDEVVKARVARTGDGTGLYGYKF